MICLGTGELAVGDFPYIWRSDTGFTDVKKFIMQDDGNFVGYGDDGKVFFATNTGGKCTKHEPFHHGDEPAPEHKK